MSVQAAKDVPTTVEIQQRRVLSLAGVGDIAMPQPFGSKLSQPHHRASGAVWGDKHSRQGIDETTEPDHRLELAWAADPCQGRQADSDRPTQRCVGDLSSDTGPVRPFND
jgi:hypothetical protein